MRRTWIITFLIGQLFLHSTAYAYDGTGQPLGKDKAFLPNAKGQLIEDVELMFRKMARTSNRHGLKLFSEKDLPGALKAFQEAYELDKTDPEITNNLAHCYELLGVHERAEKHYRETIKLDAERGVAYQNLGILLAHPDADAAGLKEASEMLQAARELRGNVAQVIYYQARIARWRGRNGAAQRHYERYVEEEEPTDKIRFEIGEFYRSIGEKSKALTWYRAIKEDEVLKRKVATLIWDFQVAREAERYGWSSSADEVPEEVISLETQARSLMRSKDLEAAREVLDRCLVRAPGYARAHMALGDLERQKGDFARSELSYLRALAIKPGSASYHLRLADLYLTEGEVNRPAAGAIHLRRALDLKPEWVQLHLRLARVYRAMGNIRQARQHVAQFLKSQPSEELKVQAETLQRDLGVQDTPSLPKPVNPLADGPQVSAMVRKLNRARALLSRGQPDAAMAQLRSLEHHDSNVLILNLEGRILFSAGRIKEAIKCLESSLSISPDQPEILELVGVWSFELGDLEKANSQLSQAESFGSTHASFYLARIMLVDHGSGLGRVFLDFFQLQELRRAQGRLSDYIEQNPESVFADQARDFSHAVDARLQNIMVVGLAFLSLLVLILLWLRRKVWGGLSLTVLLERHPESGPEVQRVLSAIRHEVLKHNTMVLTGLIEVLEQGEELGDKAGILHKSLFGQADGGGVAQRLMDYCSELEGLGRAHRIRLNLRHRDPVTGPLLVGIEQLRKSASLMIQNNQGGTRGRRRLIRELRRANHCLNVQGYKGIMRLLDTLRTLRIDRSYLESVYARTLREPALATADLANLQWFEACSLPCWALMPRHAMDDILTNLIRNAVQSTMHHGESPIEIAFKVDSDLDAITGIERVSILVMDKSPQVLTTEMLRGRYIADGLGLTADLVSQYEGSLDVVSIEGWQKAVRVRVPRIHPEQRQEA